MSTTIILLIVLAVLALFMVTLYNRLVALRQNRENSFADIDVQLKLRYDLVPNLMQTVKGYATHEKELFEKVTEARAKAMHTTGTANRAAAEGALSGALMQMMAVAENYPDLKANQNFMQLQSELADIENKIAASRRFFNNATAEFNTATEQFPSVIVAKMFGFDKKAFFGLDEASRSTIEAAPKVSFD